MGLENIVSEEFGSNSLNVGLDGTLIRPFSYVGSIPAKIIMLNSNMGKIPSDETTNYVRQYLKDSDLENVTVRMGHSRVLEDTWRLFTDKKLKDISALGRYFLGVPSTLIEGMISKLMRADYYNPFTRTAVVYSDAPAVALHELGHAKDFKEKKWTTAYSLLRSFPPGALYQEFMASKNAHNALLEDERVYGTGRYLIPAFSSYVPGLSSELPYSPLVIVGHIVGGAYRLFDKIKKKFSDNVKPLNTAELTIRTS